MAYKPIYNNWTVLNDAKNPDNCVLILPGRANYGADFARWYTYTGLSNTLIVGVTPKNLEWYPLPRGADNQKSAVAGLRLAVNTIKLIVEKIENKFQIAPEKMALAGYSAGGVMAVLAGACLPQEFAGVVCHSGAILSPRMLPAATKKTPFYLIHSRDDQTFEWEERFRPMKKTLKRKKYNVFTAEKPFGGHGFGDRDIVLAGEFLAPYLGYDKDFSERYGTYLKKARRKVVFTP